MLRFGTDGVRGVALTELTPTYVEALGAAAAHVLGAGTWLLGRDTRRSGPELEDALARGLHAAGASVLRHGALPTPALALFSALAQAPGAMITASHNPFSDNGVKVFAPGGLKLRDDAEAAIEAELEAALGGTRSASSRGGRGTDEVTDSAVDTYVQHLIATFPSNCLRGLSVVLDCANGAMSVAAPLALHACGATVQVINAEPDGVNINARCGATDPRSLTAAVVAAGAHAGLAFDGDGDRVIAVDDRGDVVDGDRMIALAALQLQAEGRLRDDTVVVTVMSNLGFHHAMRDAGIAVIATGVGDRYVLEALDQGGLSLGGEQSGHIIYRDLATTGDGLLAGLRLLQHVRGSERLLSSMAGEVMTTYPQVLLNIEVTERHPSIAEELAADIDAARAELGDEGRVLVRASGTEPLVRVMVEAATDEIAHRVAGRVADVVRSRFGR